MDKSTKRSPRQELAYITPQDLLDYGGLAYDILERIWIEMKMPPGKEKELELFKNTLYTSIDVVLTALPGAGGGGPGLRLAQAVSQDAVGAAWKAVPASAKSEITQQVAKTMGWTYNKTSQMVNSFFRYDSGKGNKSAPEPENHREYDRLQSELKLSREERNILQKNAVNPKTVNKLNDLGVEPKDLTNLIQNLRYGEIYKALNYRPEEMRSVAESFSKLVERGMSVKNAQETLRLAAQEPHVLEIVQELSGVGSKGKMRNPKELSTLVKKGIQDNDLGAIREMEIALERMRQGHEIQLGAVFDPKLGAEVGGDVVDYTTKEVIQSKNFTGKNPQTSWDDLNKASKQVRGTKGEIPPVGADGQPFKRVIEIRVQTPQHPLFGMNGQELNREINRRIRVNNELTNFEGTIRFNNQQGTHEFRVRSGKSEYINHQNARPQKTNSQSTTETDSKIAELFKPEIVSQTTPKSESPLAQVAQLSHSQYQQLPPGQLLQLHRQVEHYQSESLWNRPIQNSEQLHQKLYNLKPRYDRNITEINELEQNLEQMKQRGFRSLVNPFGVKREDYQNLHEKYIDTQGILQQLKGDIFQVRDQYLKAKEQEEKSQKWQNQPENQALAVIAEKLSQPLIQSYLQQVQGIASSLENWRNAAQALGKSGEYMAQIQSIKADYLQNGEISDKAINVMQQDLNLYEQHIASQQTERYQGFERG